MIISHELPTDSDPLPLHDRLLEELQEVLDRSEHIDDETDTEHDRDTDVEHEVEYEPEHESDSDMLDSVEHDVSCATEARNTLQDKLEPVEQDSLRERLEHDVLPDTDRLDDENDTLLI